MRIKLRRFSYLPNTLEEIGVKIERDINKSWDAFRMKYGLPKINIEVAFRDHVMHLKGQSSSIPINDSLLKHTFGTYTISLTSKLIYDVNTLKTNPFIGCNLWVQFNGDNASRVLYYKKNESEFHYNINDGKWYDSAEYMKNRPKRWR